jgi:GNAT superfamily N-acetyltransferase
VELSVGPLAEDDWAAARSLLHRAFANEPFTVEMYGEPLLERWGGSWDLYSSFRAEEEYVALGARAGQVLVGVLTASTAGHCRLCRTLAFEPRPDDHRLALDWQFQQNVAAAHASLGTHAWIEKVAAEPALHGCGIGRRLVESAGVALAAGQPWELVLECAPDRVGFYAGLGYEAVRAIADPAGPDCSLMRRWGPLTPPTAVPDVTRRAGSGTSLTPPST